MNAKLGNLLREARKLKGASLREVEKETRISNAYISQMESGDIDEPSPHKLKVLSDYYSVNYNDLMEAAGYLTVKEKPSSANTLLLASQNLSDEEAAALTSFLAHLRKSKEEQKTLTTKKRAK